MGTLTEALRRWRRPEASALGEGEDGRGMSERAGCAFGLVTRRGLEDLEADFRRMEAKIDGLIFAVVLTFLLEAWRAFGGRLP